MILIVEDDDSIRDTLHVLMEMWGFEAHSTNNPDSGIKMLCELEPDILLTDLLFKNNNARYMIKKCTSEHVFTIVVVMTAMCRKNSDEILKDLDIKHFIQKPFSLDIFEKTISNCLELRYEHKLSP